MLGQRAGDVALRRTLTAFLAEGQRPQPAEHQRRLRRDNFMWHT